ncbi:MAG: hypothetical protein BGN96_09780 [Bacteroidales bacterium 45-6]|nr:MAG: hypothetical protein BGN96_09780 [Bacteroidales bacterium 45-6]
MKANRQVNTKGTIDAMDMSQNTVVFNPKRKIESKIRLNIVEANTAIIKLTEFAFKKMNTPIGKKPNAGFIAYFLNPRISIASVLNEQRILTKSIHRLKC